MSAPKRRLPLLKSAPAAEADEDTRPAWHWAFIGAVLVFLVWAPLAMLSQPIVRGLLPEPLSGSEPEAMAAHLAAAAAGERARYWTIVVGLPALSFMIAAGLGGLLVGWLGGRAGVKEARAAGFVAAATASLLAAMRVGFAASLAAFLFLAALGGFSAWAGGRIGWRLRRQA